MAQASEALEFERAAALRDRIRAMTQVLNPGINPRTVSEADVIALHIEGGQACVQYFSFVQIRIETAIFIRASVPIIPMQRCLRPLSGSLL